MESKTVCIVLPTLNEEMTIGKVIDEIPRAELLKEGFVTEILVVDGNSADRTVEIAKSRNVKVITEPRRGKGRAIRTAFDATNADYVFMLDADYTYPAVYIPEMLKVLQKFPVVIGSRLRGKREKGAMRRFNTLGNYLLTLGANILYLTWISDLCTGFWGFRGEVLRNINLTSDGFQLEAEILTQLRKKGYDIGEVPINYRCREGKAKLSGTRDGIRIARLLISRRFHNRRDK